jgi:hypothetical protein
METSRESLDASPLRRSGDETEPDERARDDTRGALRQLHEEVSGGAVRPIDREWVDGGHDRGKHGRCSVGGRQGRYGAHQRTCRTARAADIALMLDD